MKNILFITVLIFIFAYGYFLMCKLDKKILDSKGYGWKQVVNELKVENEKKYEYLFAIGEKDLDNLVFVVFAKRYLEIKNIILICNSIENKKIFEDSGDRYYFMDQVTAEELFKSIGLS